MSEFSSKRAMIYYVDYVMLKAKMVRTQYELSGLEKVIQTVLVGLKISFTYSKYIFRRVGDIISGQSGYFDEEERQKYLQKSERTIQKAEQRSAQLA